MKKRGLKFFRLKKGSHVGVMISFLIFVVFILFIITIIEPVIVSDEDKENFAKEIGRIILENVSSDIISATVLIESSTTSSCLSLNSFFSDSQMNTRIVVLDDDGDSIPSSYSSENLRINRQTSLDRFFKIYCSEDFDILDEESTTCESLTEGTDYKIGVIKTSEYASEEKIVSLINEYSNYSKLKSGLNVPNSTEIGIEFVYANGSEIKTPERDLMTNIYIEEKQVEYFDSNANILSGKLRIKSW